jgi:predicted transposase YbfD/YdcC
MRNFRKAFRQLPDPRAANARHDLLEVLVIALAATLCGAESCSDMADFGEAKKELLRVFLRLEHGVPSHDTFSRVFRLLKPEAFEKIFRRFMAAFAKANGLKLTGVVAVDGKALRGAYDRGGKATPLHLVNVFAVEARMALAQQKAPGRNETAGALEVLDLLGLEGCIVTADALHCRPDTAQAILDTGADYVLALKENRPKLLAQAKALIETAEQPDTATASSGPAHDRSERRQAVVVATQGLGFPGVVAVGQVESQRRVAGKLEPPAVRWFLLSRHLTAAQMIDVARAHWTIENQLHWVLDVTFDEDAARSRRDNAPQNIALLRKLALNILRSHPAKGSIKGKIKRAGWNDAFLLSLLGHMR